MKRFFSLCLALMLLLSAGSALAGAIPNLRETPTAEPQAGVFTFRNGIRWNMTRELVRALESVELTERAQDGWSILFPLNRVEVSRFTADLVYMFYADALKMISYDFGAGGSDADFQYLCGALDSVYGDHVEPLPTVIKGVMDQIYPGYYQEADLKNRRAWKAGEDTLIYLYYYSANAWAILYVNGAGASNYNTTGL